MSAPSLLFETVAPDVYKASSTKIAVGTTIDMKELIAGMVAGGYIREALVESPGQFAVRGGIIDIYPVRAREPIRIEMFGDEVDSLRRFAPDTQRSTGHMKSAHIWPAREDLEPGGQIWQYLAAEWPIWVDDINRFRESWQTHQKRYRNFLRQARNEGEVVPFKTLEWEGARIVS